MSVEAAASAAAKELGYGALKDFKVDSTHSRGSNALFEPALKLTLDFGPVSALQELHKTAAIKKKYSRAIAHMCCILTTHHCNCLDLTAASEPAKSYPHSSGTGLLC